MIALAPNFWNIPRDLKVLGAYIEVLSSAFDDDDGEWWAECPGPPRQRLGGECGGG